MNIPNKRHITLLIYAIVLCLLPSVLLTPTPYVIYYKNQLYFPHIHAFPSILLHHDQPAMRVAFNDPEVQRTIRQHGWMLQSPIPYDHTSIDTEQPFLSPPSWKHWLGTDQNNHDVLASLWLGLRTSLILCGTYTVLSFCIGVCIGSISGYFYSTLDVPMQAFFLFWKSIPMLYILILFKTFMHIDFFALLSLMILFGWGKFYYLARVETRKCSQSISVLQAKALGLSNLTILFRYIFPTNVTTSLVYLPWHFLHGISAITTAELLGLCHLSYPSLSKLVHQAKNYPHAYWISVSLLITMTAVISFIFSLARQNTSIKHHSISPHD